MKAAAKRRKKPSQVRTVRARVRGRTLELLEPVSFGDGDEVLVTISEPLRLDMDALRRAAGAWKGTVDADRLLKNIYADRRISKRPVPKI